MAAFAVKIPLRASSWLTNSAVLRASAYEKGFINSVAVSASFTILHPLYTLFAAALLNSGFFSAQFMAVPGRSYILQSSTDLVHCVALSTNAAVSSPIFFTDPAAANFPRRFYRVLQAP